MSTTIVCLAIKDHARPHTESTYRKCDVCGQNIWLALSTPKVFDRLVCVKCFTEVENMDELIFHTPTQEQIDDVKGVLEI